MKRLLDQLQDKDAILLMYVADELTSAERQLVEQMLAADPALARQLQTISALNESMQRMMSEMEDADPADVSQAALRRASRLLRQNAQQRRQPDPIEIERSAFPWMRVGFSLAATVLVGCLVWWNVQPAPTPSHITPRAPIANATQDNADAVALLIDTLDSSSPEDSATRQIAAADSRADELDFTSDAVQASGSN